MSGSQKMRIAAPLIAELENALDGHDPGRRTDILNRITDLLVHGADALSDEQVQVFDDVLMHLIERIELKALIRLGEVLAPIRNSPLQVIRRLAFDDNIAVAGPVLAQSERLSVDDLVALAASKGNAHLLAMSARATIPVPVTDIMVRRGDAQVKHQLAKNTGAKFSEAGFRTLLRDVTSDEELAETIQQRLDLPLNLLRELLRRASDVVHRRLVAAAPPETHDRIQETVVSVAHEVSWEAVRPRDFSAAMRIVHGMKEKGQLSDEALERFARERKYEEMTVALSVMSGCPIALLERLLKQVGPDGLLVVCKAASLDWRTTKAVLGNRFGHHAMTGIDFESARDSFARLSPTVARAALDFWKVRGLNSVDDDDRGSAFARL
jgi:uncharacterized protein (DUF2336 family)